MTSSESPERAVGFAKSAGRVQVTLSRSPSHLEAGRHYRPLPSLKRMLPSSTPPKVFINYRRDDTDAQARLIYDKLIAKLGKNSVFMDVESIEPGSTWPQHIKEALTSAHTVVAVIGPEWLRLRGKHERRRIDEEGDWVRTELEQTLAAREKRLIPVYVRGLQALNKDALPCSIQQLSDKEAISLRHDHWNHDMDLLLQLFPAPPAASPHYEAHFTPDPKQRLEFLEVIAHDVNHRLASSVHSARFLDLGVKPDPQAVVTMWGYRNPTTTEEYPSLEAAFTSSKRRLLLLGQPGSGKTTALLHLANLLVTQARASVDAPVPFFVNLSKYNRPTLSSLDAQAARQDEKFDEWLAEEMAGVPGMRKETARQWIAAGAVAALLDGLDEFNDDHRHELARLINFSFLQRHNSMVVVVCSRTNDYQLLRGTENRIQLEGAVELLPLTESQIGEYLASAKAADLRDAIFADPSLRELAKTPLTLSMLALAYGGLSPCQMPTALSLTESRTKLFDAYVDRRLQREARRKAGKQMNDCRDQDVPIEDYRYSPQQVYRWLGPLSTVLSQRMTTAFSLDGFYELLTSAGVSKDPKIWLTSVRFAVAVWLTFLALLATGSILFRSYERLIWMPLVPAICMFAAWKICSPKEEKGASIASATLTEVIPTSFRKAAEIMCFISALIGLSHLSNLFIGGSKQGNPTPLVLLGAEIYFCIRAFFHLPVRPSKNASRFVSTSIALLLVGAIVTWLSSVPTGFGPIASFLLPALSVGALGPAYSHFMYLRGWKWYLLHFCLFYSAALELSVLNISLGTVQSWLIPAIAMTLWIIGHSILRKENLTSILPCVVGAALAGISFDREGIAAILAGAIIPLISLPDHRLSRSKKLHWSLYVNDKIIIWICRGLLSPSAWLAWAIGRAFPAKKLEFITFCEQIHLLKRSHIGGIEFIHRLLRDHFALHQLRPLVEMLSGDGRMAAIHTLGYQGEAALDLLIEITEQGGDSEKAAALNALRHIPSPIVIQVAERHIDNINTEVRVAIIKIISKFGCEPPLEMYDKIIPLGNGCEIAPMLRGNLTLDKGYTEWFNEKWGDAGRRALIRIITEPDHSTKSAALFLLYLMKLPEAAAPIVEAIQKRVFSGHDLNIAIETLLGINYSDAALPLCQLLESTELDQNEALCIIRALDNFADPRVVPLLLHHIRRKMPFPVIHGCSAVIVHLGSGPEIMKLAALWAKTPPKKPDSLTQWLQAIRQNQQAPDVRPVFRITAPWR